MEYRLFNAYLSTFMGFKEENLPEHLRSDLAWIQKSLSEIPSKYPQGTLSLAATEMSEDQAVEIAKRIYGLHASLASYNQENPGRQP